MTMTENKLDTLKQHKCPNCMGSVEFDGTISKMTCQWCDSEFDIENLKQFEQQIEEKTPVWEEYTSTSSSGDWSSEETEAVKSYICNSCAGEIMTDRVTSATHCPYCDSPVVITSNLNDTFRPDLVIPFELNKENAKDAFLNHLKKKKLLPKMFKEETIFDEISGIYVPFWLYDAKTEGTMTYSATKNRTWRTSQYIMNETTHFRLERKGEASFVKIPADGSKKMDDTLMESIEPYDYSKAVDFQTAYLSGFLAEKYDVSAEENTPRVNTRITETLSDKLRSTISGYSTVITNQKSVSVQKGEINYALMPVWIMNASYKNQKYTFAVNGQTGKFVGKLPVSTGKCFAYFAGVFAGVFAFASLITLFL